MRKFVMLLILLVIALTAANAARAESPALGSFGFPTYGYNAYGSALSYHVRYPNYGYTYAYPNEWEPIGQYYLYSPPVPDPWSPPNTLRLYPWERLEIGPPVTAYQLAPSTGYAHK